MEYWITLKATKHAKKQARLRNVTIPKKINIADENILILGPWDERGDPKFLLFVPMKRQDGKPLYYKRIPAVMKGDSFQELSALSVMIREEYRIGNAKTFKNWLKDLNKAGLLF